MKAFIFLAIWIGLGIGISQQLDAGTFIAEAFPIIWIGVFVLGVLGLSKIDDL